MVWPLPPLSQRMELLASGLCKAGGNKCFAWRVQGEQIINSILQREKRSRKRDAGWHEEGDNLCLKNSTHGESSLPWIQHEQDCRQETPLACCLIKFNLAISHRSSPPHFIRISCSWSYYHLGTPLIYWNSNIIKEILK